MVAGRLAFVFPGQGSQKAGMAAELLAAEPAARALFARANEVMGLDLAEICCTGDEATLTRTEVAQPALLATSLAWIETLAARGVQPELVAGHSLGEFAAWATAGVLTFEDTLRLLKRRAALMEQAATQRPGGMVAVIGLADERVTELCTEARAAGEVVVANCNGPGQVVVSGEPAALEKVAELVKAARGRALPLRVSGAFHSPLMQDAAQEFAALIATATLREPVIPVVANATAELVTTAEGVREVMARQMASPVYWSRSVQTLLGQGVTTFLEVGPGQVLTKLIKRIAPEACARAVGAPVELNTLSQEIGK